MNKLQEWKLIKLTDGFPVGSTVPERIEQGFIKRIDKNLIDRILILTDGYYECDNDSYPKTKEEFEELYVNTRVKNLLQKEKRDDLSYILLEV